MTCGLVLTCGNLAHEMVSTVETILGHPSCLFPVSVPWKSCNPEMVDAIIREAMAKTEPGPWIIFNDTYGSTTYHAARLLKEDRVIEVISGVNIPLLLKFATMCLDREPFHQILEEMIHRAKDSIRFASYEHGKDS
ncbi:MAG TPA: hypothetical protein PK014_07200 [Thermoanaerobaculia bacterium]|nr:hypothetical protein [Thermoanaerobaculia bacterium]HUM29968.1 hypothetical protein [Thermoanaerobaculia bacterium]HXK68165.1 hypothetical protein [Thermoanaerobaculia bacterium]